MPCPAKLTIQDARKIDDHTPLCSPQLLDFSRPPPCFFLHRDPRETPRPERIACPASSHARRLRHLSLTSRAPAPPALKILPVFCAPPSFTPTLDLALPLLRRRHVGQAHSVSETGSSSPEIPPSRPVTQETLVLTVLPTVLPLSTATRSVTKVCPQPPLQVLVRRKHQCVRLKVKCMAPLSVVRAADDRDGWTFFLLG